jgi:hypothetical protein
MELEQEVEGQRHGHEEETVGWGNGIEEREREKAQEEESGVGEQEEGEERDSMGVVVAVELVVAELVDVVDVVAPVVVGELSVAPSRRLQQHWQGIENSPYRCRSCCEGAAAELG